jgi:hypothetical protein
MNAIKADLSHRRPCYLGSHSDSLEDSLNSDDAHLCFNSKSKIKYYGSNSGEGFLLVLNKFKYFLYLLVRHFISLSFNILCKIIISFR